jgi:predicted nucleic acid-binding protein
VRIGGWRRGGRASEREKVRALLAAVSVVAPSETFAVRYGATVVRIQRASKSISTVDLLIATTALAAAAPPLVTGNRRHFEVVPDLVGLTYR